MGMAVSPWAEESIQALGTQAARCQLRADVARGGRSSFAYNPALLQVTLNILRFHLCTFALLPPLSGLVVVLGVFSAHVLS